MFKRIGVVALVLILFVLMAWFTSINPGVMSIDLAFGVIQPSKPVAFAVTFLLGWTFGLLSMSFFSWRLVNERRRLRAALRNSETEVAGLRSLPIDDAD